MKYALVNNIKSEATKGAVGICQGCEAELIAKCGEVKVDHWSHKGRRNCDPWWENETEWHRSWKNNFDKDWQEVFHRDSETSEKHIADVKTDEGWVVEFQYSYIRPEERRSRNEFYKKIVWVVNARRRVGDIKQFQRACDESINFKTAIPIREIFYPDNCKLISEWHEKNIIVMFDFQDQFVASNSFWLLWPSLGNNKAYVSPFPKQQFIKALNENKFDSLVENTIKPVLQELVEREKRRQQQAHVPSRSLSNQRRLRRR